MRRQSSLLETELFKSLVASDNSPSLRQLTSAASAGAGAGADSSGECASSRSANVPDVCSPVAGEDELPGLVDVPDVPSAVENGFVLSSEQHNRDSDSEANAASAPKRKHSEMLELVTASGSGAQLSNGALSDAVARSLLAHTACEPREQAEKEAAEDKDDESRAASTKRARLELSDAPLHSCDST